ncbi:MAG: hypothetical protein PHY15_02935 [Eubacteriales bacterium]|nr:hypothetical protein [Eubacteriales bacterium]MDD4475678.1 hypothetical protein [Eubacteriales bacterium]
MKRIIYYIAAVLALSLTITSCRDSKETSSAAESSATSRSESFYTSSAVTVSDESVSASQSESSEVSVEVSTNVSKEESKEDSSATVSENEPAGILTSTYLNMFQNGTYMIKMTQIPSKVGDAVVYSDISCYYKPGAYVIDKKEYGKTTRTVIIGQYMYSVDDNNKKIIKSSADDYTDTSVPKLKELTHYRDGIDTIDGMMYDLESFKDKDGNTVTFLYRNSLLRRMRSYIPSMDEYAEYSVEISSNYDQSVFTFPTGYEEIDLS